MDNQCIEFLAKHLTTSWKGFAFSCGFDNSAVTKMDNSGYCILEKPTVMLKKLNMIYSDDMIVGVIEKAIFQMEKESILPQLRRLMPAKFAYPEFDEVFAEKEDELKRLKQENKELNKQIVDMNTAPPDYYQMYKTNDIKVNIVKKLLKYYWIFATVSSIKKEDIESLIYILADDHVKVARELNFTQEMIYNVEMGYKTNEEKMKSIIGFEIEVNPQRRVSNFRRVVVNALTKFK